jgi:hypothetical protein
MREVISRGRPAMVFRSCEPATCQEESLASPSAQATVQQPYAPRLGRSAIFLEVRGDRRPCLHSDIQSWSQHHIRSRRLLWLSGRSGGMRLFAGNATFTGFTVLTRGSIRRLPAPVSPQSGHCTERRCFP